MNVSAEGDVRLPSQAARTAREIARGFAARLPLEPCLRYGGPLSRARAAASVRGQLRLFSPFLAAVARGERGWDEVHAAELERVLPAWCPIEVVLPGVSTDEAKALARSRGWPSEIWRGESEGAQFARDAEPAPLIRDVYPAFCLGLNGSLAANLARALAAHEAWAIASAHWDPWGAAGSLPIFLRSAAVRASLGIADEQFDLARREWARFECLFHSSDQGAERARLERREIAPNPASTAAALETGGGFADGAILWAVARDENDELIEKALDWEEAALLDELAESGRCARERLLAKVEAEFTRRPPTGRAPDFEAALTRLLEARLALQG